MAHGLAEPLLGRGRDVAHGLHVLRRLTAYEYNNTLRDLLDLAQDAGVALLHKLECFDGRGELDGWIYGICRFEFLNAVRRVRRRPRPVDDFVLEAAAEPSETSLEAERYASDIERGLATLADDERAVVRLKHFDGLTFDAIAARYGISPNTAKTRYYRGLRKLQEFMAPRRKEYRP